MRTLTKGQALFDKERYTKVGLTPTEIIGKEVFEEKSLTV